MQDLFDLGFHDALNYLTNPENPMFTIVNQLNDKQFITEQKIQSQKQISKQSSFKRRYWSPNLFPFNLLVEFCWMCILLELLFMLIISGSCAIFASAMPKVGLDRREQCVRFWNYLQSLISIKLLVKAVPALGSFIQFQKETQFGKQLHSLSILYRFLYFVL
eukprot:TRINITY_DN49038_c0_g1_i1.p3 TRINITY_DN49038_c0_g1~~TRINITY_DN49038_c0_g1_i1.p3  ORF type:complete len:162 (-),score=22.95 TRINITY_DN49038_c0_g1_i1:265-750(-)